MAGPELIAYNSACFICALYVLEYGADKFIDHTTIVSRRTGISPALIGLLTAGAEWEELIVVVVSVARNRPSLALGNIIGSSISNILGAFSLGLLFHSQTQRIKFDRRSKVYSLLLLALTVVVSLITVFGGRGSWKGFGGVLLALFVIYTASVGWAISRGAITSPEKSDSEDSDDESTSNESRDSNGRRDDQSPGGRGRNNERNSQDLPSDNEAGSPDHPETEPLIRQRHTHHRRQPHSLTYHTCHLVLGFL